MAKAQIYDAGASFVNGDEDLHADILEDGNSLESYVLSKVQEWEEGD